MSDRPYSRLYWEILDDEKFDGVRDDVRHLGTWALLLVVADMAWPAPAFLPPVPKASVRVLADRELVDLQTGNRYRIHGLDKERNARADKARASVTRRYDRTTTVERPKDVRSTPELLAEPSREQAEYEPTREANDPWATPEMEALAWLARHGCSLSETSGFRRKLIEIVERFGSNAVIGKFDRLSASGVMDGDVRGFIFGAADTLYPKPDLRALERDDRAEDEAAAFNRRVEKTQREIARLRGEAS